MTLDVRSAAQRLGVKVDRSIRAWAAQDHPVVRETISLQPPTERAVLADQQAVRHWIREWREVRGVVWEVRRWPSVGTQTVPVRLVLEDLDAVLAFTGATARWRLLRSRFDRLRDVIGVVDAQGEAAPVESALRRVGASVEGLADVDVDRLLGVLIWLRENPTTGMRIRALPIRGVDSKWVERHRGLLKQLHGLGIEGDSFNFLPNPPLVTARFLDTTLRPGGVGHAALPIAELRALPIEPRTVLVCENLETVLTLPQLDGVVALFGAGYKASGWLKELPWVSGTRVLYWGDLDSHGFAILDGVRSGLPHVESILMDSGTLLAHRDLWVTEPDPSRAFPSRLTAAESSTFDLLREYGNPRLEQERIPWATALAEIQRIL